MITFVVEFHLGLFMEIEENGLTMASRESNEKEEEEERGGERKCFQVEYRER